jgi:hypothetical protein
LRLPARLRPTKAKRRADQAFPTYCFRTAAELFLSEISRYRPRSKSHHKVGHTITSAPTRGAGTCHNAGCWARHGQLTNAALAAWFGAFEEPPRMSSERDACLRRADDAKQRAAQATEPSIKSAYEKVATHWMLLARLESLLAAEKNSEDA